MQIYKKGNIVAIRGMATVHKGMAHKALPWQNQKGLQCHPACHGHHCKQAKGKILAKIINVWTEDIKHSKSRDGFLKRVKRREPKKGAPGFSWSISLLHPEKHVCELHSWLMYKKKKRTRTVKYFSMLKCGVSSLKENVETNFNGNNSLSLSYSNFTKFVLLIDSA